MIELFLFILRERGCASVSRWGVGRERERERERMNIPSRLCVVSKESDAGLDATNPEMMT